MKYISKNSNLMVVLKTGIPGNAQLGTQSIPGLYVRFKDGIAEIDDENINELMEKSPAFNVDFIQVQDEQVDPYAALRSNMEPTHTIKEIRDGRVGNIITDKAPMKFTPEVTQYITQLATEIAKSIVESQKLDKTVETEEKIEEKTEEKPKSADKKQNNKTK